MKYIYIFVRLWIIDIHLSILRYNYLPIYIYIIYSRSHLVSNSIFRWKTYWFLTKVFLKYSMTYYKRNQLTACMVLRGVVIGTIPLHAVSFAQGRQQDATRKIFAIIIDWLEETILDLFNLLPHLVYRIKVFNSFYGKDKCCSVEWLSVQKTYL